MRLDKMEVLGIYSHQVKVLEILKMLYKPNQEALQYLVLLKKVKDIIHKKEIH